MPEVAADVSALRHIRPPRKLTQAALETLFLIMRRGALTRSQIAAVRDPLKEPHQRLDPGPVLLTLRREGLVVKAGNAETPGAPALYRATIKARERFPDVAQLGREILGTRNENTPTSDHEPIADENHAPRAPRTNDRDVERPPVSPPHAGGAVLSPPSRGAAVPVPAEEIVYLEIEVSLLEVRPRRWRRFLLRADATCQDLHEAICDASGSWSGEHLWQIDGRRGVVGPWELSERDVAASELRVHELLEHVGDEVGYRYDFGDDWQHRVVLKRGVRRRESFHRRLVAGAHPFPPEDCGGPPGYVAWRRERDSVDEWAIDQENDPEEPFEIDRMRRSFDR